MPKMTHRIAYTYPTGKWSTAMPVLIPDAAAQSGENAPRANVSGKTARLRPSGDGITQRGGTPIAPQPNRTGDSSK